MLDRTESSAGLGRALRGVLRCDRGPSGRDGVSVDSHCDSTSEDDGTSRKVGKRFSLHTLSPRHESSVKISPVRVQAAISVDLYAKGYEFYIRTTHFLDRASTLKGTRKGRRFQTL